MVRYASGVVLGVALAVCSAGVPAAGVADGWPCGVVGAKLVVESRHAVVAKLRTRSREPGVGEALYYGCLRSSAHPVVVGRRGDWRGAQDPGDRFDDEAVIEGLIRLRGRFVAVVHETCLEACDQYVTEWNLRRRHRVYFSYEGTETAVRRIFLTARGALAYVLDDYASDRRSIVVRRDAGRREVVAQASPPRELPLASVRLRRHRLVWVLNGEQHSLRLR